jgi:membrane-bound serine protease (ClpP class)
LLTAGGLASLMLGSMILVDSPQPELQLSLRIVIPVVLALAAIAIFVVRLAVSSQRLPTVTGAAGMIGETARALTPLEPGQPGRVATHGEIWTAIASEPIAAGEHVRVTGLEGLTLTVTKT